MLIGIAGIDPLLLQNFVPIVGENFTCGLYIRLLIWYLNQPATQTNTDTKLQLAKFIYPKLTCYS